MGLITTRKWWKLMEGDEMDARSNSVATIGRRFL